MIRTSFFLISIFFLTITSSLYAVDFSSCRYDETEKPGQSLAQYLSECGGSTEIAINARGNEDTESAKNATRNKIKEIAQTLISLGALLAVGAVVWAGIQYTKAYGDDESLKKAKNTGIYALIGLLLLLLSFGLVDMFIGFVYEVVRDR